jgi:hypothetical protein
MKKKKVILDKCFNIYQSEFLKINYEKTLQHYYFEIYDETSIDLAEAVIIMMNKIDNNNPIWKSKINKINLETIEPSKSLYWLTGGKDEWVKNINYKKNWHECVLDYQTKFGMIIIEILNNSQTFNDVRKEFIKQLNMNVLYEFALQKEIA